MDRMSNTVAAYTGAVKILKRGIDIARTRQIEGRLQQARHYLELAKREAGVE